MCYRSTIEIAQLAKKMIVIVTAKGCDKIKKNFPFKKKKVNVDVLKVLSYDEIKDLSTQEISQIVRDTMLENIKNK